MDKDNWTNMLDGREGKTGDEKTDKNGYHLFRGAWLKKVISFLRKIGDINLSNATAWTYPKSDPKPNPDPNPTHFNICR